MAIFEKAAARQSLPVAGSPQPPDLSQETLGLRVNSEYLESQADPATAFSSMSNTTLAA